MSSAKTKLDSKPTIPFDSALNTIIHQCERDQIKLYDELKPRVEAMYNELSNKLLDMYNPVIEACCNIRGKRNRVVTEAVQESLKYQLEQIIENLDDINFDPDDLREHLVVHVWTPEFETHYPYCDSTIGGYQRLKMEIQVSFPTVAEDEATRKIIALTTTEYEDLILSFTPLHEQQSTVTRARDCITFNFEYVYDNLTIEPDSTYCDYPAFPTRPVPTTR
tara:strand:- start:8224 stop:8886 length:663 start_codon:yes stop_codon:yes gene_type:complete